MPLNNVEIINSTEKFIAKSDDKGEFQIQAKLGDELVFFLNGYHKVSLKVTDENSNTFNKIILEKNTIELDEIEINKTKTLKIFRDLLLGRKFGIYSKNKNSSLKFKLSGCQDPCYMCIYYFRI